MTSPLRKPEGISWSAAAVELPPMPVIPPGADAMSMTIAAVLPTLEASMTANVTSLAAKEETFSGKVGAAQAAYNVGDESAGQSVGQMGDMLGQLGQLAQMPQQAASSLGGGQSGGQGGGFGQLMQQAMQTAQGAAQQATQAAQQGQGSGAQPMGAGAPGVPTPEQRENEQNDRDAKQDEREDQQNQRQATQDARDRQQDQREAVLDSRDQAAPGPTGSTAGPAPIAPHGPSRPTGGEDLSRQV